MLSLWDCTVGTRIRKYRGHQSFVNTCDIARRGPQQLCSASDDCTVRVSLCFYGSSWSVQCCIYIIHQFQSVVSNIYFPRGNSLVCATMYGVSVRLH
jgi:WD40 repeat protein